MWSDAVLLGLALLLAPPAGAQLGEPRVVQTRQGPVRGYRAPGDDAFAFYGIPYATAPTGQDRFKAPLPGPVWLTTFEAVDGGVLCPQFPTPGLELLVRGLKMREDCLVANVYAPATNATRLPVVVYVHGGAFQIGFGSALEPKRYVARENIVAVTFNYRLGVHGFLCLGTRDVPGNAGMKDQVALLRWVRDNAAAFGGDPAAVTVAGYSAGGAAAELLMLSPLARGLFERVAPESGGSLPAFAVQTRPLDNAKEFARRYIPNADDVRALEHFYRTASFQTLTSDSFNDRKDNTFLFSPCVESVFSEGAFLQQSPYSILRTGNYRKVPLLFGFDDLEGLLRISLFDAWKGPMNTNFTAFLPPDLQFRSEAQRVEIANRVKRFYFGNETVGPATILGFVDLISDVGLIYPIVRATKLHVAAGHDRVYLYEYSFYDNSTAPVPYTNVRGAPHIAQTVAVFDSPAEDALSPEYVQMKAIMRDLWGSFVRNGVPQAAQAPAWPPAGASAAPYMSLGRERTLRLDEPLAARMRLWEDIYERHYRAPSPPTLL